MSIRGRLRRLEGRSPQCPECGWPPLPGEEVEVVVTWHDGWSDDGHDEEEEPHTEPRYCEVCGEPDVIVVTWGPQHQIEEEELRNKRRRRLTGL